MLSVHVYLTKMYSTHRLLSREGIFGDDGVGPIDELDAKNARASSVRQPGRCPDIGAPSDLVDEHVAVFEMGSLERGSVTRRGALVLGGVRAFLGLGGLSGFTFLGSSLWLPDVFFNTR